MNTVRTIAIHLPQFHPIPENNEWWGNGFTEWTNVTKASPQFPGHYQPHLPSDLGFYDLRLKESIKEQSDLAKQYGIEGFCYYHYWFNGNRLLHRPLDILLDSPEIDFPFMFCWANENWSRRWDGDEQKVLIKQEYSETDDEEHIRFLCRKVFSDKRYIRLNGKPFMAIYRPKLFPNIKKTLQTWRNIAQQEGIGELYMGYMQSFEVKEDPINMGFDVAIDFQPDFYLPLKKKRGNFVQRALHQFGIKESPFLNSRVFEYADYVQKAKQLLQPSYKFFPSVTPMWDNTARRKEGAYILNGSTPLLYGEWLKHVRENFKPFSPEENFIFINAWNEWAEGNHLEPCQKWGRAYLEATKKALDFNES